MVLGTDDVLDLPIPKLNEFAPKKAESLKEQDGGMTQTSDGPGDVDSFGRSDNRRTSTNLSESPSQNRVSTQRQSQSYGFPDTDPWGSPEMHRGHNHSSGTNGNRATSKPAAAERTTSEFTTASVSVPDLATSPPTRQPTDVAGLWGGYTSPAIEPGLGGLSGATGFGSGDEPEESNNPTGLGAQLPRLSPSGPEEVVTVVSLPEKEGMFLFQHRNYQVTSARRGSKVIRRYSDFAWLLDCLHKRYPFRQLPLLPPKRVASMLFSSPPNQN
jgi:sorting nexin-8